MPRSTTPNLKPFIRSIARETVKAAGNRLPSAGETRRLSARIWELEKQVRELSRWALGKSGKPDARHHHWNRVGG